MASTRTTESDTTVLEMAVRDAVDAFWYWNFEEKAGWVSDRWYELTGAPKADGTPTISDWSSVVHPDDLKRVSACLRAHLKDRVPYDVEFRLLQHGGGTRWVRARAQAEWRPDGRAYRIAGSTVDIEALKKAQADSSIIAEQFRALCESSSDGILIIDVHSIILYSNPAAARIFGHPENSLFGANFEMIQPPHLRGNHLHGMQRFIQTGVRQLSWESTETYGLRSDGREIPIEIAFAELRAPGAQQFVAFVRDITLRRESEQRIKYLALHDPLTGLLNRTSIEENADEMIALASRSNEKVALMYIDLDRFKPINDWLGHAAGDELLTQVAERLLVALPSDAVVGRQGGDEFIVVLPHVDAIGARQAAQAMLDCLQPDFYLDSHAVQIGGSIGVTLYPNDGELSHVLLANADAAMYHAKAEGRNRLRFYSKDISDRADYRLRLEHELRGAIKRGELSLVYQPIYSMANNRLMSAEALLRWNHPTLGEVPPTDFITVAESSGLIILIGAWVLARACEQLALWRAGGHPQLTLAVNVSARQLFQGDLVSTVEHALRGAALPSNALVLEVTESGLIEQPDEAARVLKTLTALGVSCAIDDFGTGFSSLSYLKRFPFAQIKIDRSFIQDLTVDANDAAIVSAVIAMGRSLCMTVVAEGVETEAQALSLRAQGCHHVQGFWFSRPLSAADFTKNVLG